MSYSYKYNFVSPEGIYATIIEEFKSYYDTGAIDSLLFPVYLNKSLEKLGLSSYKIVPEILQIENFEARLPDNFRAIREAWLCVEIPMNPYQTANSFYSQTSSTTIQIEPLTIGGEPCDINCPSPLCEGNMAPEIIQAVYKTNYDQTRSFRREFLLKPGNLTAREYSYNYTSLAEDPVFASNTLSPHSAETRSFDIRDNKFVVTFRNGTVYISFYAVDYDGEGNQLIPDNYRIKEYIEAFIKFKMMETLTNQTNDETFNQLQQKLAYYKQQSEEAFIIAKIETQKTTVWQKQMAIKRQLNSFNMYELPNRGYRYRRN